MKKNFVLSTLLLTFSTITTYAHSTCEDFTGHYYFDGDCKPSIQLILPEAYGFLKYIQKPYAPMNSKGSFEIKQEGCEQVTLISHALISTKTDERNFVTTEYKFSHEPKRPHVIGIKSKLAINTQALEMSYEKWDLGDIPGLMYTSSKSTWFLSKTDIPNNYTLKIKTREKNLMNILPSHTKTICRLKRKV